MQRSLKQGGSIARTIARAMYNYESMHLQLFTAVLCYSQKWKRGLRTLFYFNGQWWCWLQIYSTWNLHLIILSSPGLQHLWHGAESQFEWRGTLRTDKTTISITCILGISCTEGERLRLLLINTGIVLKTMRENGLVA